MNLRKKTIRMLAVALSLSLVSIGAIPAKADCSSACCCEAPSGIHFQDITSISQMTRHMQEYSRMHEGSHEVHKFFLLVPTDSGGTSCHERTAPASCGMEPLYSHDALKGIIQAVPRAAEVVFYTSSIAVTERTANNPLPFGPASSRILTARARPYPLYLHNLSLLI